MHTSRFTIATAVSILPLLVMMTGCGDAEAIEFAQKARDILDGYQRQLQEQIAEAETHYLTSATLQADSAYIRRGIEMAAVRSDAAEKLAFAYADQSKNPGRIREELSAYAATERELDLATHRGAVERSRAYVEKIEALRVDKDKLDAFAKLLDGMTVKRPIQKDLEEIGKFVDATKVEFDKLVCSDLEGQIRAITATGAQATDAEKSQKTALEDLFARRNCTNTN